MTEAQLQRQVAQLLDDLGWLWTHVPNEGRRSPVAGRRLREAGLKRGVPDVLIWERYQEPGDLGLFEGVAIELKTARGRVSPEQRQWLTQLEARRWATRVCRSWEEVLACLECVRPINGRRLP